MKAKDIDIFYEPELVCDTALMSHDEWLESRKKGIGGSDRGVVLGVSKWNSRIGLYKEKVGETIEDKGEPDNWFTLDYGHALEPLLMKYFGRKTGFDVWDDTNQYRHPVYPFMIADCDFMARDFEGNLCIGEIKTTDPANLTEWHEGIVGSGGKVPASYEYQARHYMAVMNVDKTYFVCCSGNSSDKIIITELHRDLGIEAMLIEEEKAFWDCVVKRTPPQEYSINAAALKRYREETGCFENKPSNEVMLFTDTSLIPLCREYADIQAEVSQLNDQVKSLKERQNAISVTFTDMMTDCEKRIVKDGQNGYEISFKMQTRQGVNTDLLSVQYPEIYEKFKTETLSRPFSIKEKTEKQLKKLIEKRAV